MTRLAKLNPSDITPTMWPNSAWPSAGLLALMRRPISTSSAAFNTAEGWSRDVTKDFADEIRIRQIEYGKVPRSVQAFVEVVGR
jgi:hypothetical protein